MRTPTWVLEISRLRSREVGEGVLTGRAVLRASENDWDWLGKGIYFWENKASRALEWAKFAKANPKLLRTFVKEPFVVGAVNDLGNCLDLLEAESIRVVKETHEELRQLFAVAGSTLPVNTGAKPDRVVRRLDCAVINYVHEMREQQSQPVFDSVRAVFVEGEPLYEDAGFHSRTHIQVCVRREAQIIGYFRVRNHA